jgi:hypothetical protein
VFNQGQGVDARHSGLRSAGWGHFVSSPPNRCRLGRPPSIVPRALFTTPRFSSTLRTPGEAWASISPSLGRNREISISEALSAPAASYLLPPYVMPILHPIHCSPSSQLISSPSFCSSTSRPLACMKIFCAPRCLFRASGAALGNFAPADRRFWQPGGHLLPSGPTSGRLSIRAGLCCHLVLRLFSSHHHSQLRTEGLSQLT